VQPVGVVEDGLVIGFLEVEGQGLEDGPDCVETTDQVSLIDLGVLFQWIVG
jgi:hypothetical protein